MSKIIYDLSNEEYHHGEEYREYISSSQLKLYAKSPRYARYKLENPDKQTDAMQFGALFHDAMQAIVQHRYDEWKRFDLAVFNAPISLTSNKPFGTSTKTFKEAFCAFKKDNLGKTIVNRDEIELIDAMTDSLLHKSGGVSDMVNKYIIWAKNTETSYFFENENGIKLKVRPDMLTSDKVIDWKTCALDSLDIENITRQIVKYRYDVSLSMYQYVLNEITGVWYSPRLVFVSKELPYESLIVDISEWCFQPTDDGLVNLGVGAIEFNRLLELHSECVKKNQWPGIDAVLDSAIMKPEVPYYLGRKYFEE